MENAVKTLWSGGKAAINGWLTIPSGFSAEIMAQAGWDSVTIDLQHGVQDYHSMVACFQAMQAQPDVVPMVRVPWNEPGIIGKVLDGGAYGIICPMVNTRDEARRFVDACRYPPSGQRSSGPIRAGIYGKSTSYQETANQTVLVMPMIESREAVDNLDAILDVEGYDAVYVGPADLAFTMGLSPTVDREETEILKIFDRIVAGCQRRGLAAGIHVGTAEYGARAIDMGFKFISILNDSGLMLDAARSAVATVRSATRNS